MLIYKWCRYERSMIKLFFYTIKRTQHDIVINIWHNNQSQNRAEGYKIEWHKLRMFPVSKLLGSIFCFSNSKCGIESAQSRRYVKTLCSSTTRSEGVKAWCDWENGLSNTVVYFFGHKILYVSRINWYAGAKSKKVNKAERGKKLPNKFSIRVNTFHCV